MPRRTLKLNAERLSELSPPELVALAGGAPPTWDCQTVGFTCQLGWTRSFCPTDVPTTIAFHTIDLTCIG